MTTTREELTREQLAGLCLILAGKHMRALDCIVCGGAWPVVDAEGRLTGDTTDGTEGGTLVDWTIGALVHDESCSEAICFEKLA